MTTHVDVLIIGGSLAGSTVANCLRNSGIKTLCVEKNVFPRSKSCGEGLSSLAVTLFKDLPFPLMFDRLSAIKYRGYSMHYAKDQEAFFGGTASIRGYGVERKVLDAFVAGESSAECPRVTARVESLEFRDGEWKVTSAKEVFLCKFIVIADGAQSVTAKRIGIPRTEVAVARFGLTSWWTTKDPHMLDTVEVVWTPVGQVYITPVGPQKLNVTVLGNAEEIKEHRSQSRMLADVVQSICKHPVVQEGIFMGAGPFNARCETFHFERGLIVGDAAETFDPASGLGMYHAALSGYAASEVIKRFFSQHPIPLESYSSLLDTHNKLLRRYNTIILFMMQHLGNSRVFALSAKVRLLWVLDSLFQMLLRTNLETTMIAIRSSGMTQPRSKFVTLGSLAYGLFSLVVFAAAVLLMNYRLFVGLQNPMIDLHLHHPLILDFALLLQFPILHSLLLGKGRRFLHFGSQNIVLKKLSVTTYVIVASLQLLLVFGLWQFAGPIYFQENGVLYAVSTAAFLGANLYLIKAMADAGLGLQLGYAGWLAVLRGQNVNFPPMPEEGTFRHSRQPIYLAFLLMLWLSPLMTLDKLLLASMWSLYCLIGPLFKERRFTEHFKDRFLTYKKRTPYFIPYRILSPCMKFIRRYAHF